MELKFELNGKKIATVVEADSLLLDVLRSLGCASVKRGCESSNCGLCTVFVDDKPVLSCSVLAARVEGRRVTTLEGLQDEAADFGAFIADQGAASFSRSTCSARARTGGTTPISRQNADTSFMIPSPSAVRARPSKRRSRSNPGDRARTLRKGAPNAGTRPAS